MFTLNKKATAVLDALTAGLTEPGTDTAARKIGDGGAFMAVHVERIGHNIYSVAHYYTQNGDLVCDPDVTFLKAETGKWLPLTFEQGGVCHRTAVEVDAAGRPTAYRPGELRSLVQFCNMWMSNMRDQQGGLAAIRAAAGSDSAPKG